MKKKFIFPLIFLVPAFAALIYLVFYLASHRDDRASNISIIEKMEAGGVPSFTRQNLDGGSVSLDKYKGKVVIVNFWASWCAPCIEEIPSLIKLVDHYDGRVQLVAVSGDSSRKDIDIFMKSFKGMANKNIEVVWDEDKSLMALYGVERLPESYIAYPDHKLAKKIIGTINWFTNDSIEYVDSLLKK